MPDQLVQILPYILVVAGVGALGGVLAAFWSPGIRARSGVQHFAAGAVIAAVAAEVIPEVKRIGNPIGVLAGFAAGGLAMVVLKWVVLKFERREKTRGKKPIGLAAAAALDTAIDGAIIGAGFSTGQRLGTLLAMALAVELFFLNLSVGSEFYKGKRKNWLGVAVTSGIALLLILGFLAEQFLLKDASEATVAIVMSFGSAALIYLVAEELLVESIQAEENLFSTMMLFAGFLAVLAFDLLRGTTAHA
jgi:ZIP family zinc transporter